MNTPSDLITSTAARRLLGISTWKMSQLLKSGRIRYYPDPLDERKKLVSKSEVESLKITYAEAA
jgi:hypothetical protein